MFFKKDQGGQRRKGLEKSSSDFLLLWLVVVGVPPGWSSAWSRAHLLEKGILHWTEINSGRTARSVCLSRLSFGFCFQFLSLRAPVCSSHLSEWDWETLSITLGRHRGDYNRANTEIQGKGAQMRKMVVMFRDENLAFSLTGDISLVGNNPESFPEDHWNYLFFIIIHCTATSSLLQNHLKGCMYELKLILLLWNSSIET